MKVSFASLVVASLLTLLLVACSRDGRNISTLTPTPTSKPVASTQPGTVRMNTDTFLQTTITIKKGQSITLEDDATSFHVIANGTWQSDGLPKYALEQGAPKITLQFHGNDSHSIGPFTTAGTFHMYCTVHEGMNLTVIVT